jgi:hypothetical protein
LTTFSGLGPGHGSLRGHTHGVLNPIIKDIVERYR